MDEVDGKLKESGECDAYSSEKSSGKKLAETEGQSGTKSNADGIDPEDQGEC